MITSNKGQGCLEYLIVLGLIGLWIFANLEIPIQLMYYYSKAQVIEGVPQVFKYFFFLTGFMIVLACHFHFKKTYDSSASNLAKSKLFLRFLLIVALSLMLNAGFWFTHSIATRMFISFGMDMTPTRIGEPK